MDLDRIKRNVAKMAAQSAPVEDIDGYITSEGATVDQVKSYKARPSLSTGETAVDAAKSFGVGLAQGAIGIPTLPGNIEYLARAGIDKAATMMGYEDPQTSQSTVLPTYSDAKGAIEQYTGPFYEPQSTVGEYARTVGEFAPLAALGPGGAAARGVNVVAPAVVSETAGQLTKGTEYEPWARAGGALAGGFLPNAAMRTVTPAPTTADRAAAVEVLRREGVTDLTAGQKTGAKTLRTAESVTQDIPFGGSKARLMDEKQAEQFTRAALRRVGVNATRANPEVIDGAFKTIGKKFDDLASRNNMRIDDTSRQEMIDAVLEYRSAVPETMRSPIVQNIDTELLSGTRLSGEAYKTFRSRIERIRRGSRDPELSNALTRIRDALDDGMERSMPAADKGQWRQVRGQYRNLLAIETAAAGAGENAAMGLISPAQLRNAVKQQGKRAYVRGQGDLSNLARAGEAVMKPLPNSGTAPRSVAAGALGAGGYASFTGDLFSGLAMAAAPAASSRLLMSRPVQNYLSNQVMAGPANRYNQTRLNALQRLPQAALEANQPATLSGGIGPRYDEYGNPI